MARGLGGLDLFGSGDGLGGYNGFGFAGGASIERERLHLVGIRGRAPTLKGQPVGGHLAPEEVNGAVGARGGEPGVDG